MPRVDSFGYRKIKRGVHPFGLLPSSSTSPATSLVITVVQDASMNLEEDTGLVVANANAHTHSPVRCRYLS